MYINQILEFFCQEITLKYLKNSIFRNILIRAINRYANYDISRRVMSRNSYNPWFYYIISIIEFFRIFVRIFCWYRIFGRIFVSAEHSGLPNIQYNQFLKNFGHDSLRTTNFVIFFVISYGQNLKKKISFYFIETGTLTKTIFVL